MNIINLAKENISNLRLNLNHYFRKKKIQKNTDPEKVTHLKKGISCHAKWYGSTYGGFYIHPDILNAQSIIYSFGTGKDITFDLQCIKNHRCHVFAFDPTPKSIQWIKSRKINPFFHFYEFGISSAVSAYQKFYLPSNPRAVSGSLLKSTEMNPAASLQLLMKTFQEIVQKLGHSQVDVVKMDIEGAEYEVLPTLLNSNININQILVEFHDRLFDPTEYKSKEIVEKLRQNGYEIFAVSGSYEEVSFIRRDIYYTHAE